MATTGDRRNFLGMLVGAGGGIAALLGAGTKAEGAGKKRKFQGTSKTGDYREALQNAIAAANSSAGHPDAMVEWTLKEVSGRAGGIAGFRDVTVTIEAKVS